MKALWKNIVAAAAVTASVLGVGAAPSEGPAPDCKAAYLCDAETGTEVYSSEKDVRLPIASMCKIMTLLLSFEAAESGELDYSELITVSANAAGMGGSQVFLAEGLSYPAEELIKTVAVSSANDSSVALAERIAGSETAFVERMNRRARELGAENTLFSNCTGLPREPQYSTAKDVAIMLREMIKHEKYFEFSRIPYGDFAHPDGRTTRITNTNKLIKSYTGCDGGKTGFTSEAGFCLAATAKKGETRLISVVIGASDSKKRFKDVGAMLDYAFERYETKTLLNTAPLEEKLPVRGSRKSVEVAPERPLKVFVKRGETEDYTLSLELGEAMAPLKKGEKVGSASVYRGGVEVDRCDLLSLEDALKMSWWEAVQETARNWQ